MDVGSGKTLLGLSIIDELLKTGPCFSVILCPKTALTAWVPEIEGSTDFTYSVNDLRTDVTINLITFPEIDYLFAKTRNFSSSVRSCLIVDETHILTSEDSKQARDLRGRLVWNADGTSAVSGIIERFTYAYGMTATLMGNHIQDVYFVVQSFFPGFFRDLESFLNDFTIREVKSAYKYNPIKQIREQYFYKEVVGYQNLDYLSKKLEPLVFRHFIDYKPKVFIKSFALSEEELEHYYSVAKGLLSHSSREFVGRLSELQDVVNGSVGVDGNVRKGIDLSTKEQLLADLLNEILESGEGAVVFTQLKKTTLKRFQVLRNYVKATQFRFLSGDSSDKERDQIRRRLSVGEVLFSTKAGGQSMNLQAVNNIVLFDLPWSAREILQSIGRITRNDSVYDEFKIHIFSAKDTIDEYKLCLFQSNLQVQKDLFGGFNFADVYLKRMQKDLVVALRGSLLHGVRTKGKKILPTIKCKCGHFTNSAVSEWSVSLGQMEATGCYARWDENRKCWIKGCIYDSGTDEFLRDYVKKMVGDLQ